MNELNDHMSDADTHVVTPGHHFGNETTASLFLSLSLCVSQHCGCCVVWYFVSILMLKLKTIEIELRLLERQSLV